MHYVMKYWRFGLQYVSFGLRSSAHSTPQKGPFTSVPDFPDLSPAWQPLSVFLSSGQLPRGTVFC